MYRPSDCELLAAPAWLPPSLSVIHSNPPKGDCYLAGPMRGYTEFNFPAFHLAARVLRDAGYVVFSPAEKDIERWGRDISKGNLTGSEEQLAGELGVASNNPIRVCLGEDLAWICAHATHIALLPGFRDSKGAMAEYTTGVALGLEALFLRAWNDTYLIHLSEDLQ